MTLRQKTLLGSGFTLVTLMAVLYFVTTHHLMVRYAMLETQETEEQVERAEYVLDSILLRIDYALVGWSQWDDSYKFIRNNDPGFHREFVAGSLSNGPLAQCRSDVIIYVRNNGQIIFGTGFDRGAGKAVPLPVGIVRHLSAGSILLRHPHPQDSKRGIVMLPGGALLLVSRPVVTNAGKGPIYGSLIWGRFLRSAEIKELSQLLQLPLSVQRFDAPHLPPDFQAARTALNTASTRKRPYFTRPLDEDTVAGYLTVKDFYGRPAMLMRGVVRRDIYQQGQSSVRYLLLSLLTIGLIFGLLTLGSLERWVLAPLSLLSRSVKQISTRSDVSVRVPAGGHDEISQLAQSVNSLLTAVEQAEQVLRIEIVERVHAEQSAQQARVEAEGANAAKSEFLSRMSHELRTPLNAILGFGQILDRQDLTPRSRESVGHILKGGRHLLGLINEVLDIARVEAGHLELSLEPIALADVVPDACALVRPLAAERNIRLDDNTGRLGSNYVLADLQRLKQVLLNLLSNAIKYNREDGQVEVSCEAKPDGWIAIVVRDTGPGISPQDLPKLFTPFERLNASTSEIEGTGLGLVLSQRLVTIMGGTLNVESTLGQGTTFTLELPESQSPESQLANVPVEKLAVDERSQTEAIYCVLCIEDNPSNLRLLEVILQGRPGITLMAAIQGSVGLDLARQHEPDLILLDLNLPDMHGEEVLIRLQQSALTRDIPVIVVSADATPTQIDRLLAAGAKAYLTKPLDVSQLLDTVETFLEVLPVPVKTEATLAISDN